VPVRRDDEHRPRKPESDVRGPLTVETDHSPGEPGLPRSPGPNRPVVSPSPAAAHGRSRAGRLQPQRPGDPSQAVSSRSARRSVAGRLQPQPPGDPSPTVWVAGALDIK